MVSRELLHFDNLHSVEGMQELFRAKSIRATVDAGQQTCTLTLATGEDLEQEIQQEHAQQKVIHVERKHATAHVAVPEQKAPLLQPTPLAVPLAAGPTGPVPGAFEHLEALERLLPQIVDLFLRHGRLNSGDKEVLKNIRPVDGTLTGRVTALERWQTEVNRRVRGLHVPKATAHLVLGAEAAGTEAKPEEELARRFDSITIWVSKLIKAFEHTGVKFHAKPMWLPH
jgi:hypothetical protein